MNSIFKRGLSGALAAGALGLVASDAAAQVGGAAVVFLQIEPDSRGAAMGSTGVATADNANAIFWNPANLAGQRGTEIGLTHSKWLPEFDAGLFYEYAVAKHHVEGVGTFGAHATYLNLGTHQWTDESGNDLGEFKSYDLALGLSYARSVTRHLDAGVSARYIYSNLTGSADVAGVDTKPGTSVAADLGLLYKTGPIQLGGMTSRLNVGLNLANFGGAISYSDQGRDPIPTNLRFGLGYAMDFDEFNQVTFAADFNKAMYRVETDSTTSERTPDSPFKALFSSWKPLTVDIDGPSGDPAEEVSAIEQITVGLGAEYLYNKLFAFRTGYFYENPYNGNRQFLTFGAGVRYNIVGVDFSYIYALEEDSPLDNTLRFSLLVNFLR